jgi:hypothetical protein
MIVKISLFFCIRQRFICKEDLFANRIYYANTCEFNEEKCVRGEYLKSQPFTYTVVLIQQQTPIGSDRIRTAAH